MKKVALLVASLILCAGLACAQNPKKPAKAEKPLKEAPAQKVDSETAPAKPHCGKCPEAAKCNSEAKSCNKDAKSCDNKENKAKTTMSTNNGQQKVMSKAVKPEQKEREN